MPVFNCAGTVAQAICSILNQTVEDWELLIIDDGSTDNTLEIAASFDDPRISVTRGEENKGLPARLNECVSRARGKYFERMDQDDIAYPGRLQHPLTHEQICAHPWNSIPMAHPTWMGKLEWFRRNPYRTDAPRQKFDTQDQDLLLRTHQKSRFAIVPEIVLGYRENSLSLSKILYARRDMCKTMVRVAREQHMFTTAALGIVGLIAKALVDTLAISTGLKYHILPHRATAIRGEEEIEWRTVWEQVRLTSDRLLADHKSLPNTSQSAAV